VDAVRIGTNRFLPTPIVVKNAQSTTSISLKGKWADSPRWFEYANLIDRKVQLSI